MKSLLLLLTLLVITASGFTQTAAGKWKIVSGYMETYASTREDMYQIMIKNDPCLKDLVYVLTEAGMITLEKDLCKNTASGAMPTSGAKWSVKGNVITLTPEPEEGEEEEGETFNLQLKGKKMIWEKTLERNPNIPAIDEFKLVHWEFERQ